MCSFCHTGLLPAGLSKLSRTGLQAIPPHLAENDATKTLARGAPISTGQ